MDNKTEKVKIYIADEQLLFRQGIQTVLMQEKAIEVCGEFTSGRELLTALRNDLDADVILLDTKLSPQGGIELTRAIKKQSPGIAVVLLTAEMNEEELFEAIKSRASAYLGRNASREELIDAILMSAAGKHPINETLLSQPKVAQRVLGQFQDLSWGQGAESLISPLTLRETEILKYMAEGYLNKQIADTLSISEQTIKNHITSILRKLDANARTQAVIIALKRGLISLS